MAVEMINDNIWYDKWRYEEAECQYFTKLSKNEETSGVGSLATKISKAREVIQNSLATGNPATVSLSSNTVNMHPDVLNRLTKLEGENSHLVKTVSSLEKIIVELTKRLSTLECGNQVKSNTTPKVPQKQEKMEEEDDDDVDLFGSDDEEEDEEASRVREERLKAYAEKKAKKPGPIAKSSVLLDIKPWDDETNMEEMEKLVRKIVMDGLVWGAGKFVPLAYGIKKLSILCIVEDEKVSIDDLIEKIVEFEDIVQSVDIGAFNKI